MKLTDKQREQIRSWAHHYIVRDEGAELYMHETAEAFVRSEGGFEIFDADDSLSPDFEAEVRKAKRWPDDGEPIHARIDTWATYEEDSGIRNFHDYQYREYDENPEYTGDIVEGLIAHNSVNAFVALPGALKSWAAYSLAGAIAKGAPWLDRPTRQGRAVILDWEMGSHELRRRLRLLGADEAVLHTSYPPYDLHDDRFWASLSDTQASFFVVDSLTSGSGAEYANTDHRFAAPLRKAAAFIERRDERLPFCCFVFILHSPKGARLDDVESLFGGTGTLRSAVDSGYYFARASAPPGEERARVVNVKSRKMAACRPFEIRMTDARGIELVGATAAAAKGPGPGGEGDDDLVLAAVVASPGTSSTAIAKAIGRRGADVRAAVKRLLAADRIRVDGKGRATQIYPV